MKKTIGELIEDFFEKDTFVEKFKEKTNKTTTENGANANKTTGSDVLDFFAQGGALRNQKKNYIISMFDKAYYEDKLLALRTAFYLRDIRGGQGERRLFRIILNHLGDIDREVISKNIELIPEYGRWDDLYSLFDTKSEELAKETFKKQLVKDLKTTEPSLLAKWLKSENASSNKTKRLGYKTRRYFGLFSKEYRKLLSALRERIKVVEKKMSNNNWKEIDYEKVPSRAHMIYKNAFKRHDPKGYNKYLNKLEKGEIDINSDTLYPYELVDKALYPFENSDTYLNEAWNHLPDYIDDENSIAVIDTSGSMAMNDNPRPIDVAISLGLYMAERNKGKFHNKFITFSHNPEMVEIKGSNFVNKVRNISNADWYNNTDIKAVFDLILDIAVENNLNQNEIPSRLYIISDMEFDRATSRRVNETLFEKIENIYNEAGYKMPQLVFWNVDARNKQFPMKKDKKGVQLISGFSPSIFKETIKGEFKTPYNFMLDVINSERYEPITIN